ncbi:PREDICTED: ABC transporter F family member 4 [Dinoponera quadriceps]|uniref:ABC transporter F family member 4 n=1 Tax=Dinoponera quadriceps TaxID=609295 RepID=A0A6P3WTX4_DINQU|nr:PREDICTED: ABC transporter F family member 4 [Dinoponera quadriceps]
MKLTLFTILALCIIAVSRSAEEEYDYEEEAAAPVTPAPTKPAGGRLGSLLSSRGRVNVANVGKKGRAPAAQSTTSKPVEQEPEEDEVEDEDVLEENEEQEAPTTTTESAKKLRSGGVRPFRSNEDLLAALKRRRAQTGSSSHPRETAATHSAVEHTTAKSKATTNSRAKASTGGEARSTGRGRFGGRGKTVQEEVEETQQEEIQVRPKTNSYRRGGRS